jgi:uncharacterized membrane protein YfcA
MGRGLNQLIEYFFGETVSWIIAGICGLFLVIGGVWGAVLSRRKRLEEESRKVRLP